MAINHNQATVHLATPYDDQILIYNKKLNATYVSYGSYGREKKELQAEQDLNAKGYSDANAVSRTISKGSRLYKNSSWDLVDAAEDESFDYEELKNDDLPKELKGKSMAEIKTYISKKSDEREVIQKEIQELNIKRKAYILEHQKDIKNGLESAMIQAIKTQAKKKNYNF